MAKQRTKYEYFTREFKTEKDTEHKSLQAAKKFMEDLEQAEMAKDPNYRVTQHHGIGRRHPDGSFDCYRF